jgi:hypothetical protein
MRKTRIRLKALAVILFWLGICAYVLYCLPIVMKHQLKFRGHSNG